MTKRGTESKRGNMIQFQAAVEDFACIPTFRQRAEHVCQRRCRDKTAFTTNLHRCIREQTQLTTVGVRVKERKSKKDTLNMTTALHSRPSMPPVIKQIQYFSLTSLPK